MAKSRPDVVPWQVGHNSTPGRVDEHREGSDVEGCAVHGDASYNPSTAVAQLLPKNSAVDVAN